MENKVDAKRIWIFLAFAFGIAWAVSLVIYLVSGRLNTSFGASSGQLVVFLAIGFGVMWAPALANILTRSITKEGWANAYLRPNFRKGWGYWLLAWFSPVVLTIIGLVVYFTLFPQHYDPGMPLIQQQLEAAGIELNMPSWLYGLIQLPNVLLVGLVVNSFFTFGEEFGWRAYLLQKLLPMGSRKAVLLGGVIWGVWHWPLIAMGHNYGLDYAGAPWLGMLAMVWFTTSLGILFSWMVLRAGSVWPAVIGHAIVNAVAGLGVIYMSGEPNMVLGPTAAGLVGGVGFALLAVILLLAPNALQPPMKPAPMSQPEQTLSPQ
jgi:membrane protease YdiL (CAAX protease family)